MDADRQQHLSQIATRWSVVRQAHGGEPESAPDAQRELLERYSPAIYRYLAAAARDPDAADDLFQEFALRVVRGDFRRADPSKGRFRDFLKTALYHLVVDHQRRGRKRPVGLADAAVDPAAPPEPAPRPEDDEFARAWRAEVLARAWEALAAADREDGGSLHLVLRFRTDHPDVRSPEMAEQLSARLGRPVTAGWVRKRLHLARERFADLVVAEVARTAGDPAAVEQELLDLGLLDACRGALERRSRG